ncbi:GntP family permease [Rhodopirellula sp. MGV]|uniref:GntP family permease n=1 Tax=Rhodopirellula sp. MGV TaxID=2023130 RepID=UPI000B95F05A|nr:SLC13 family permease [Rhodopirellula sp. MGV]OYP28840.1 gluconate permease [Rhodopirellula sp. MGV]PNY37559.1 gluconate permease [Rhodopirellula baltica]
MNIWWIVALAITVVLVCILRFRLHAFMTLLLAGLLVAGLTDTASLQQHADREVAAERFTPKEAESFPHSSPVKRLSGEFGNTVGRIGILIALASVIGGLLSESGAANTIVARILAITGPRRAPEALAVSSFIIGIPVFFDTVFYLMVPLARSMRKAVGKNYVLFLLAIMAGGSIAHSLIPPTPGPLQVAEILGIDVGVMLIAGLAIGVFSSTLSLASARLINHFVHVPFRESEADGTIHAIDESQMPTETNEDEKVMPGLWMSLLPIIVPVVLITLGSVIRYALDAGHLSSGDATEAMLFVGDKNIAIAVGVALAFRLVGFIDKDRRQTLVSRSLASAGNIILITAAGGAFGKMLYYAGIATAVSDLVDTDAGLVLLPVAFLVTAAIRTLQGSATVGMITAAGVLQGFASSESLPFHPVYLAMAIGAGSKPVSWMTDSAFWVITRMSGMTESEGLKTLAPMSTAMGLSALVVTVIAAWLVPAV